MARERERDRESTRSREETSTSPRSRERTRERDRNDRGNKKGGSGKKIAINLDPKSYEQYGLWGDGEDILVQDAWAAPFNYGGKTYDDGKQRVTLALWFEYLDEATGETHIEPVSYGDLRHHAPGLSPNELDFAGGDETTWARVVSGDEEITDDMRGPYVLPVPQGFDSEGEPIYRRLKGSKATNGDWYIQSAIKCANAAGVPLKFDPDDPNLRTLFRGIRGRLARLPNTLRKTGTGESDKNPPLVFEEIYERVDLDKSDKAGSGARRSRTAEPDDDKDEAPAPARRGRSKKANDGPTDDFLKDFEDKVEAFLSSLPKKSCKRTRMADLYTQYDIDSAEERWALEVLTDEKYIDTFWKREKGEGNFDYDEDTDTASL